ncbi:MAG: hypothetical protein EZS28_041216 [Streblomastix strix]|uniref:Uncharacterized protein n=1 Tax=Streblomastix strix TaxID=222440 RepID=A0A5J4TYD6_9EUKA|nr:MAG: hypothetical protein EZS28_041216 [Streblomastix strix]
MSVSAGVDVQLSININQLLDSLGITGRSNYNDRQVDGGRFISSMEDKEITAAFYHPSKMHSATVQGGFLGTDGKSIAKGGQWAIARGTRGPKGGSKTFYNII